MALQHKCFKAQLKENILKKPIKKIVYLLFSDDIFMLWTHGQTALDIFRSRFNLTDPNIRLTMSIFFRKNNVWHSPVALQLRAPPKVSARAPAHRSYHFRGVKLKSCIKKIHHNLYISKQANVRIKHADTEGASHKKFGTDARVQ